jgi:hypothetical protein
VQAAKRFCPTRFQIQRKEKTMANTKAIESVEERKKLKRAARKKAAPKGPRTGPRGEAKAKVRKASRGTAKRK